MTDLRQLLIGDHSLFEGLTSLGLAACLIGVADLKALVDMIFGFLLAVLICSWCRYIAVRLTTEFTNLLGCGMEVRLNPEMRPQIHTSEPTFTKIDLQLY
jgi:hypothetical protein